MGRTVGLAVAVALSAQPATAADLDLATHGSGQVADGFGTAPSYTNLPLFRFRLQNTTGSAVTVDEIRFRLRGLHGFAFGDATNLRIHDGTSDVATGGLTQLFSSTTGAFTFLDDWTAPASSTVDYTLYGDIANLAPYDTVPVALDAVDITTVASVGGAVSPSARHVADGPLGAGMQVVYSDNTGVVQPSATNAVRQSHYQNPGWVAPGVVAVPSSGLPVTPFPFGWKAIRTSPDYSRQAVFFRDQYNAGRADLWVSFWDGINWDDGAGAPFADAFNVSNPLAGTESSNNRSFDAAYEALSGRLLVVSGYNTIQTVRYSVWDGSSWVVNFAGQGMVPGSGFFTWLKLASIPGTNKIAFIGITSTGPRRPPSGTGTPTSGAATRAWARAAST